MAALRDNGEPGCSVDLRLWGKSRGLPAPYPLVCHLVDAAAMAQLLWDEYLPAGLRRLIAGGLDCDEDAAGRLVALWTGLHDIGKATPGFQAQDRAAFGRLADYPAVPSDQRRPHGYAAHVWLGPVLARAGYPVTGGRRSAVPAYRVAQLLGGHHGRFFEPLGVHELRNPLAAVPELGDGAWEEQREALYAAVTDLLKRPDPPSQVSAETAALVCGVVILADWLVSQDDFLKERLPEKRSNSPITASPPYRP